MIRIIGEVEQSFNNFLFCFQPGRVATLVEDRHVSSKLINLHQCFQSIHPNCVLGLGVREQERQITEITIMLN